MADSTFLIIVIIVLLTLAIVLLSIKKPENEEDEVEKTEQESKTELIDHYKRLMERFQNIEKEAKESLEKDEELLEMYDKGESEGFSQAISERITDLKEKKMDMIYRREKSKTMAKNLPPSKHKEFISEHIQEMEKKTREFGKQIDERIRKLKEYKNGKIEPLRLDVENRRKGLETGKTRDASDEMIERILVSAEENGVSRKDLGF